MTKIMLVEDDKSLREIYGVRLLAEGYDIVSAGDGEEALAMAIKERPQLIVSDVMMPKVSGYDMLDILRSTTETKNIRVIMMTALSSEEQRQRAESLGADRYLVKSQVGIEDVVRVVHEVLEDTPATMAAAAAASPSAPTQPTVAPTAPSQPVQPVTPPTPTPIPAQPVVTAPAPAAAPPVPPAVRPQSSAPKPASLKSRVIQPLNDPTIAPVNINDLLDKELAKEAGLSGTQVSVESIDQEKADLNEQLKSFTPPEPTPVEAPEGMSAAPVATEPSLLPTPGVGSISPSITPTSTTAPATTPSPVPLPTPPTPPVPPAPQATVTPAPAPVSAATPASAPQPTMPAPVASPAPVETAAPEQPKPASDSASAASEVVDLTKLPEVPKIS